MEKINNRLTAQTASEKLRESGKEFVNLFEHGSLQVEIYRPDRVDKQHPHLRDEVYIVLSGKGFFIKGSQRNSFEPGEVLFVPAGIDHKFEDFSDDFMTWVIFFGPVGGE